MSRILIVLVLSSVFIFFAHGIHVPGENVDKKTLTTLGIKTIGWQSNEHANDTVNVHHNYSKVSLQNEKIDNYSEYSQPQTDHVKPTTTDSFSIKKQQSGIKGPRPDYGQSQTTFRQDQQSDLETNRFSQTPQKNGKIIDQKQNDLSNLNSYAHTNPPINRPNIDNSGEFVSSSNQKNIYTSITGSSNGVFGPNELQRNVNERKPSESADEYQNVLDLDEIMKTEQQYRELQKLPGDIQGYGPPASVNTGPQPTTYYKQPSWRGLKFPQDPKASQYQNQAKIQNLQVAYLQCPKMATGQFIFQSSCHQFLNCWKGRGYVQNCSPGTLFNPQTLECDFALKVECLNAFSAEYEDVSVNAVSVRKTGIACPPEFSGVIPHKTNCSKFINCANGVEHVMDCAPGTLFSLKINSCDYPYKAECAGWSVEFGNNNINNYATQGTGTYQTNPEFQSGAYFGSAKGYSESSGWENQQGNSGQSTERVDGVSQKNENSYVSSSSSSSGNVLLNNENVEYQGSSSDLHGYGINQNKNSQGPKTHEQNINYEGFGTNTQITESSKNQPTGSYHSYGSAQQTHLGQYTGYDENAQRYFNNDKNSNKGINKNDQKVYYGLQQGLDHTPKCPQGASGVFPHPTSCAKYLNCANGQTFIQDCGPGTVFNPQMKICDFPYNVECYDYKNLLDVRSEPKRTDTGSIPNSQKGSTSIQDQYEGAGSNVNSQYVEQAQNSNYGNGNKPNSKPLAEGTKQNEIKGSTNIHNEYQNGNGWEDSGSNVHGQGTGNYGNNNRPNSKPSYDDSSYHGQKGSTDIYNQYENDNWLEGSSSNTHGQYSPNGQTQIGSHGTLDNANTNKQENAIHDDEEVNCPYSPVGFYPHPSVCSKYFICANGKATVYKCGTGTVFNPVTMICDVPQRVKCYVGNVPQQVDYNNYNEGGTDPNIYNPGQNTETQTQYTQHQQKSETSTENQYNTNQNNIHEHGSNGNINPHNGNPPNQGVTLDSKSKKVCDQKDFYCSPDFCISEIMVCDGAEDCPNGNDELNCEKMMEQFTSREKSILAIREKERYSNLTVTDCAQSCLTSKGFHCKSFSYRSDAECLLSDSNVGLCGALIEAAPYTYYELAEFTLNCTNMFKCPNDKCINTTQICDGVNDCGDRTDEKNCTPQSFGYEIRLAGSSNKHEGRIELKAFGKSGYICDDRFGMRNADVVCREVGFPLGALEVKGNSHYAKEVDLNDVLYLMDDVVCLGNETSIKDCDFNGWGVSNCEPQEIVGVVCKTPVEKCPKDQWQCDSVQECIPFAFLCDNVFDCTDQSDEASQHCEAPVDIRLAGGKSDREGRIEIRHHGVWGTVCDDDFNDDAAKVVCNYLGFPGKAASKKDGVFGEGEGPIWLDQVFCQGNETLIQDCTHWNWGEHNCEHSEDVGVVCSGNSLGSAPTETGAERNTRTESPNANIIEVAPEEILPSLCGLRKDAIFGEDDDVHFRVIQGSVAKKGFYPWQASLRIKNSAKPTHWCGAVVISRKFVLTAAHCLVGFSKGSYIIIAGDYNTDDEEGTEQEIFMDEFYIHEEFRNGQKMNNDIALVKLKGIGFTFTKDVQPICLPESNTAYTTQLNCTISGFGSVQTGKSGSSHDLRAGWVPIQAPAVCKMPHVYGSSITDGMFCAGSLDEGVDACEGDSGGPLACLHEGVFTLYGITSWGQHCGHANKPGVYVKVSYYRNWIDETIRKNMA